MTQDCPQHSMKPTTLRPKTVFLLGFTFAAAGAWAGARAADASGASWILAAITVGSLLTTLAALAISRGIARAAALRSAEEVLHP